MAKKPRLISITSKLIEFEDYMIHVPSIASVGIGPDPWKRGWAAFLFFIAFQLFSVGLVGWQMASYFRASIVWPLLMILASFGLVYWGVMLWLRKGLWIAKADSRMTVLVDKNPQFMRDVMARIREAILLGEGGNIYYQVNVQAERIDRLDANATMVSNSPGANVVGGSVVNGAHPQAAAHDGAGTGGAGMPGGAADLLAAALSKARDTAAPVLQRTAAAVRSVGGVAQEKVAGLMQGGGRAEPSPGVMTGGAQAGAFGPYGNTVNVNNAHGAVVIGGSQVGSQASTQVSVVNDFDAIMSVLLRERVTHGQEIIDYLRPVRDHLAGGGTPREEARNRWAWFAGQAVAALSGIDGALAVIERISRLLGVTRH